MIEIKKCRQEYFFTKLIKKSKISTVRIICFNITDVQMIRDNLSCFECETEYMEDYKMISVSVPSNVDYESIQQYLMSHESNGILEYEESAIRHL